MKKVLIVMAVLCVMLSSSMAFSAQDDAVHVLTDTFLFRPMGAAVIVGGAAAFIVSLPIAAVTNSIDTTANILIKEPFDYTFRRPLGEIKTNLPD